ncbi:hypothetical protein GCM10027053_21420 [Intrasporangium mesophilum]
MALKQAGRNSADVVRTRKHITNVDIFNAVGAVHSEIFSDIRPVTAAVELGALAAPGLLLEEEADVVHQR